MTEEYLEYWGMSKPPFSLTPDPEMLYLSTQHSECLMRLKYAIFSHKGGALLVSDNAGNGKTSALARLQNELREYYSGRVRVVFIDHPTLTPIEMIGEISRQLGGELNTTEKIRSLNFLRDRLFALYNDNIKVVVIVDEGQMLKERPDILQELRILLNFCVSDAFLLTFIFSGQKPLDGILRSMPEFWQRLPVRFFLKNLDFNDTRSLIQFRLRKVGVTEDIFTQDAYEGIYNYSEGCPRVICSVADLCLLIGFSKRVRRIGFVEVSTACRDMESTGDSFHYFAYIKSRDAQAGNPESETSDSSPKRIFSQSAALRPATVSGPIGNPCPQCDELNEPNFRFCRKCGSPLRRKCPKCGALTGDTTAAQCPSCHADMDRERLILVERLRESLLPFDVLEGNYPVWLQAAGIELARDERLIIIFPRGGLLSSGTVFRKPSGAGLFDSRPCDFLLSDRRLLVRGEGEPLSVELDRIETCVTGDNGKKIGRRYSLTIGSPGGIFTVDLPVKGEKGKRVCEEIAGYIRMNMIKE